MNTKPLIILGVLAILGGQMQAQQKPAKPEVVAVAPQPPKEVPIVSEQKIASSAPHDYGCDTYPVRARGYTTAGAALFPKGSCVSVGKGRFLTAAHIFTGLQAGYVVEVSVGGEWQKAVTFSADAKSDFAELTIAKTDVEGVAPRKMKFGEKVTVYGLTTCEPMHGVYVGDKHVGLEQETKGIDFGDSGGGVYGEDGALVGLIRGFGDDRRSVYIAPVVKAEKQVAQANAPPPPAEPKVSAPPQVQSCPNGQCQSPQVYQFQQPRKGFFRFR